MKKFIKIALMSLMCLVLVWGLIATFTTVARFNAKTERAIYAKDGRMIVSSEVADDQDHLKVETDEMELISESEMYKRHAKHAKILLDDAKKEYEEDDSDTNRTKYENAQRTYAQTNQTSKSINTTNFVEASSIFFGTYLPIAAILGITLFIVIKTDKKCKKED